VPGTYAGREVWINASHSQAWTSQPHGAEEAFLLGPTLESNVQDNTELVSAELEVLFCQLSARACLFCTSSAFHHFL
jgi:hypothetical protein